MVKALSDRTRRQMLALQRDGPRTAGELADVCN
jgi:DNA-binding transcriptional ArsR family regulator